jgi:hydroxymethylglutaryl-CoA reductase
MNKRWVASMTLALLCAGSGWSTTVSAQDADAQNNKLVFAVVVNQIFNQGDLALVDDFMAKDVTNNGAQLGRDGSRQWSRISARSRPTSSSRWTMSLPKATASSGT